MSLFLAASNPQDAAEVKQLFFVSQELKKRGFRFFVLTNPGTRLFSQAKLNKHPVITFKLDGSSGWLITWRLARLMKKLNLKMVHFFDQPALGTGLKASQKAEVPAIIVSGKPDWLRKIPGNDFRQIDALVFSTDEMKRLFLKSNLSVPRIEVIPPGIDFSQYLETQKKKFLRQEFKLSDEDFLVGLLTPLEDLKILKVQFEAIKILQEQAPKLKVIIFGQGSLHLEQLRHDLPVELDNVYYYLGFADRLKDIVSSLDMFIFGAFSLPEVYLLEAMVWKVPVIGIMAAGMTELIVHRETGFLVPPNDPQVLAQAVLKLYLDRSLAVRLSRQAYDLVFNKHSCEAMAQRMVDNYELLALQKGVKLVREGHHT